MFCAVSPSARQFFTHLRTLVPFLIAAILVPAAFASGPYVIGSPNTVTADPNVSRPSTSASQLYNATDSTGANFCCTLPAANNVLTAFSQTCSQ